MKLIESTKRVLASAVARATGMTLVPGTAVNGWLHGAGVALPHEPFAGAWQRNLEGAANAGPNILAFSGVYACINIISQDVARMPVRPVKKNKDKSEEEYRGHYAWRLFARPNDFQTTLQFVESYMQSKLTHGNTYVLLMRDARGVVNEMFILDPRRVRPLIAEFDGSVFYEIQRDPLSGVKEPITVPARDILHDRAATMFHPLVGVSPLFAAGVTAMLGGRITINSEKFFANMSRAGGMLVSPGKIEPAIAKKLQNEWETNYGPRGLGRTVVLANGLDFKPLTINSVDSDLVNQLRWVIEDIARVYRVPGFKLGDLNKVNFRNSETLAASYLNECLSYHIKAFEDCFNRSLELTDDVRIKFDTSYLLRMETDTRYAAHQTALQAGFKSINEVRAEEGLPPVKGGDEPRVQMQYVPLSMADKLLAEQNADPPADKDDAEDDPPAIAPPKPKKTLKRLDLDLNLLTNRVSKNLWGAEGD